MYQLTARCWDEGSVGIDHIKIWELMDRITKRDALFAVSLSPYATSTLRVAELAHTAGAKIVAVTDSEYAPIARLAQVVILVSARSPSFFDTISPALAAAEVLVALLASRAGPNVPDKIRRHERHLRAAGVFWSETKRSQQGNSGR
jgi:DNA-binding MurR/RpiR family transcriptional regulator